ncbi:MAG: hypothetical protein K2W84_06330 [Burkholderiales bacterium]|nr:hypothetical protein [Burkholderiales bacterium]
MAYVAFATWPLLLQAQQPAAKPAAKPVATKPAPAAKAPAPAKTASGNPPLRGRLEKLSCRLGTEDRHARIAIELIGGRTKSVAYYSKSKPRTCSMHVMRDDAYSKWVDTGHVTVVTLNEDKGSFLIDHEKRSIKFLFRDIDRERFCAMPGRITGSLTVTRGSDRCELEGVMDGHDLVRPEDAEKTAEKQAEKPAEKTTATP